MDTFLATFLGVILSFILSVLSVIVFRDQKDKKALEKLVQEMTAEIELNIIALQACIYSIEQSMSNRRIAMTGPKLSLIVYEYIVASGEFRLITDPNLQTSIRHTAYFTQVFNDFLSNTELNLAIINLKEQNLAVVNAITRMTGLHDQAKDTKTNLENTLNEIKNIKLSKKFNLGFGKLKIVIRI